MAELRSELPAQLDPHLDESKARRRPAAAPVFDLLNRLKIRLVRDEGHSLLAYFRSRMPGKTRPSF